MDSEDLFVETPELAAGPTNGNGEHHSPANGAAPQNGNREAAAENDDDDDETQMDEAVAELSLNNEDEIAAAEAAAAAESDIYGRADNVQPSTSNGNGHHPTHDQSEPDQSGNDTNGVVAEFEDDDATEMQLPADDEAVDNEEIVDGDYDGDADAGDGNEADEGGDDYDAGGDGGDDEDRELAAAATSADAAAAARDQPRLSQLPLSRIKALMKINVEFSLASSEAVFMMCKATELFIESLARESFVYTAEARKKTVQFKDLEKAIESVDALMFLEGALSV